LGMSNRELGGFRAQRSQFGGRAGVILGGGAESFGDSGVSPREKKPRQYPA